MSLFPVPLQIVYLLELAFMRKYISHNIIQKKRLEFNTQLLKNYTDEIDTVFMTKLKEMASLLW